MGFRECGRLLIAAVILINDARRFYRWNTSVQRVGLIVEKSSATVLNLRVPGPVGDPDSVSYFKFTFRKP